jgi:multidrug efflux pump subunit AcrA (membrane-fusion protein)
MIHSVVATATVQTSHRANSGVQITGKVLNVNVLEGERFRQGQVLLFLEASEAQVALLATQLGVRQAQTQSALAQRLANDDHDLEQDMAMMALVPG